MNHKTKYLFEYRRVSTNDQLAGQGMKIQEAGNDLKSHLCSTYDLTPYINIFDDAGVSAYKTTALERPAFGRMMQILDDPNVSNESVVVLYNWDRLSRQDIHSALTTLMQITAKVRLYIMSENRLFDKADPDLMVSLMMALVGLARAGDESKMKSNRTVAVALNKIQAHINGERTAQGNARYIGIGKLPFWCSSSAKGIELDAYYAPICAALIQRMIDGEGTIKTLDWLNANYKPPKTDAKWGVNSIGTLHKRKSLIGECSISLSGQDYMLSGYIPRLISDDTYWKLVAIKKRRTHSRSPNGIKYIFTGLGITKCGSCGGAVSSLTSRGRVTLRCVNRVQRITDCKGFNISGAYIEEPLFNTIGNIAWETVDSSPEDNTVGIQAQIAHLQERLNQMEQDYISNPSSVVARLLGGLEDELATKNNELETMLLGKADCDDWIMTDIPTDLEGRRELIRRTFESILILKLDGSSRVLLACKSKRGYNFFIYIIRGVVIKSGEVFTEYADQVALFDPRNLSLFVQSPPFAKWVESAYSTIDAPADIL